MADWWEVFCLIRGFGVVVGCGMAVGGVAVRSDFVAALAVWAISLRVSVCEGVGICCLWEGGLLVGYGMVG